MKIYTQSEIDTLISCQKIIIEPPSKEMRVDRGHLKKDMKLQSIDSQYKFNVFMRINEKFSENFSIGLIYVPTDDVTTFTLIRFNGPHGGYYINDSIDPHPHFGYHIHRITEETMKKGIALERDVNLTKKYSSFADALRYFIRHINITNAHKYFEKYIQLPLFGEEQ